MSHEEYEDTLPETLPGSDANGLGLSQMWELVELMRERRAFDTACGMRGRSVLDYPPGFRFGDPRGLSSGEAGVRWFHAMEPSYEVWSRAADDRVFTIGWYSDKERAFNIPNLEDPPVDVVRHQWLLRALTMHVELPGAEGGVVG